MIQTNMGDDELRINSNSPFTTTIQ